MLRSTRYSVGPNSERSLIQIPHQRSRLVMPHVERDQIGIHQLGVRFLRREGGARVKVFGT